MTCKSLFSKSLTADPDRLHFAAHSHHLWPDAAYHGHMAACEDALAMADHKWEKIMGPLWSTAQQNIANELNLPEPDTVAFAPNTHDFLVRIMSAIPKATVRVLTTNGEFHSFRRQMDRWIEDGKVKLDAVHADTLAASAQSGDYDLIFASQILFNSGTILGDLDALAALARPDGPWVVIDGYHGFMAIDTDLSSLSDRIFYLSGGYKYAMSGEGACFLHAPPSFAPRPPITGWYAAFDDLALAPGEVGYAPDGRRFLGSTFDPSGLYRFNAVQDMLKEAQLTTATISDHVAMLQTYFLDQCPLADMALLNPHDGGPHARFLAFQGQAAAQLESQLRQANIVTDVRGDVIRIGFALYHDTADVDRLVSALRQFCT
ncbi:MAG: class V aminotransferase [Parasphingorhabdus sp.]|uniref:kynureninase/PvdN C-terminal domain-containing protein n=1 Tax=Parasphingorhabdus sp. TaxID=2709688 RepID=UPI00329A232D